MAQQQVSPVGAERSRPLPSLQRQNLFLSIIDCLHFTVTTLSTVGYVDVYPTTWYSKLAVDMEILPGPGITVLNCRTMLFTPPETQLDLRLTRRKR
ncbi:MAG TPA: potassium channel family protein [Pyrinomonadaceae bacterium]